MRGCALKVKESGYFWKGGWIAFCPSIYRTSYASEAMLRVVLYWPFSGEDTYAGLTLKFHLHTSGRIFSFLSSSSFSSLSSFIFLIPPLFFSSSFSSYYSSYAFSSICLTLWFELRNLDLQVLFFKWKHYTQYVVFCRVHSWRSSACGVGDSSPFLLLPLLLFEVWHGLFPILNNVVPFFPSLTRFHN